MTDFGPPHLPPGTIIDEKYEILEVIGIGGMSVVYRVQHVHLLQQYALKVFLDRGEASLRRRFVSEARILARLRHSNIVVVQDLGELEDYGMYIVMELLDGHDLGVELREIERIPWKRMCRMAIQLADALSLAHREGIVHRDIKPSNCVILRNAAYGDLVKLIDFGIARINTERKWDREPPSTRTGQILGTAGYLAPEYMTGGKASHRVDIYALAVLMFRSIAGCLPFSGQALEMAYRSVNEDAPLIHEVWPASDVPPDLETAIRKGMARDPQLRFESADSFGDAIRHILLSDETSSVRHSSRMRDDDPSTPSSMHRAELYLTGATSAVTKQWLPQRTEKAEVEPAPYKKIISRSLGRYANSVQTFLESCFGSIEPGPRFSLLLDEPKFGVLDPRFRFLAHGFEDAGTAPNLTQVIEELGDVVAETSRTRIESSQRLHWIVLLIVQARNPLEYDGRAAIQRIKHQHRAAILPIHVSALEWAGDSANKHRMLFHDLVSQYHSPNLFRDKKPVDNPLFFFGRERELEIMLDAASAGISIINIVGAIESGKTSLVNHLGAALFGRRQEKVMERLAGQVCGVRVRDRRLAGWCR
jgi:serine/threonine protein kinase